MPRIKTYSANSGFVYEYRFTSHDADGKGDSYHFSTTQDRKTSFDAVVFLPVKSIREWETAQDRTLTPTERYAIAKMALFAAFDQAVTPCDLPRPVTVNPTEVREILQSLDI